MQKVATVIHTAGSLSPSSASADSVVTHASRDCRSLGANIAQTPTDNDDIRKTKTQRHKKKTNAEYPGAIEAE